MKIDDWMWLDFTSVPGLLDWIAFVLGGAGILFTVVQLVRSRGALIAARDALNETRQNLTRNQLVALLPSLESVSSDLDRAVRRNKRSGADEALQRFSVKAAESATLLAATTTQFSDLVDDFISIIGDVADARAGLFANPTLDVHDIAGDAARRVRDLIPTVQRASTVIRNDPGSVRVAGS